MSTSDPVQPLLPGMKRAGPSTGLSFKQATALDFKVDGTEGIVEGYAATWDRDLGGDRYESKAFDELAEEFSRGALRTKAYREHFAAVGLPEELKPDAKGLFIKARIVPGDTQDGDETLKLAARGVYDAFSVAWKGDPSEMRIVTENGQRTRVIGRVVALPHVGILADPMNPEAQVTAVKGDGGRLDRVLAELGEIKAGLAPAPAQLKSLWDLSDALEHMAILEGIRMWGELTTEQAEQARELIDHLVAITEETKRHLPQPAGAIPAPFAALYGRMNDYANQLRT
ncbi:MAG: hypothetical protein GY719_25860 [bacterium]|nr:hypothetical protein [bacterium]